MDKRESEVIKGIAILFLLFLHLFGDPGDVEKLRNFLYIDGVPLTTYLSRITSAVYIFLFVSGYGLYKAYEKSRVLFRDNGRRILRLYIHYWIVMVLWLLCGALVTAGSHYWGDVRALISNATAYDTSWNFPAWFIAPYCVAALASPLWCKFVDRSPRTAAVVALAGGFLVLVFLFRVLYPFYVELPPYVMIPTRSLDFIAVMMIGAFFARKELFSRIKYFFSNRQFLLFVLLMIVMCVRASTSRIIFHREYMLTLIVLLVAVKWPKPISAFLEDMGRRSTTMWLCHAFFCYYFLKDLLYSLGHPAVVYVVLVGVSYLVAVLIDPLVARTGKIVFRTKNKEVKPDKTAVS